MNALREIVSNAAAEAAYFEDTESQNAFLQRTIGRIKEATGAAMAAVFVHDPESESLEFRAGMDSSGTWDKKFYEKNAARPSFALGNTEVGRAFTENRVLRLSFPQDREDYPFRTKTIVPISRGPQQIGILLLGRTDDGEGISYTDEDLLALASDLGELVEDSSLLLAHTKKAPSRIGGVQIIRGKKASDGRVEALALPFWEDLESISKKIPPLESAEAELARYTRAFERALSQLDELQSGGDQNFSDMGTTIFLAHSLMIKDRGFTGRIQERIAEGDSAVKAILSVVNLYAARFSEIPEVRIAEKAQDVRDLGYRLIRNLDESGEKNFSYNGRIALARHIYPSDLMRLAMQGISGIVLFGAGVTAHISILAKSLNVPVLITDDKSLFQISEGTPLFLDAGQGLLYIHPRGSILKQIRHQAEAKPSTNLTYTLKGSTADRVAVQVAANVNILKDAVEARRQGAEGIGLYRSEFPFILKNDFLSEEQQFQIYRSIAATQQGKPVILRTADIGGDKIMQGRGKPEENPFLGVRGIRFSLANKGMFGDQLRAMLRAGHGADLGIMLPMVSSVEEVLEAKEEIERAVSDLRSRGAVHNPHPKIGAMIELPSAALAVSELARETDFLSIGTNDLTMYLLAVDRTNENLSHLYRSHHPSVLRVLKNIVEDAGEKRTDISICGDVASDPYLIPFFVGIGIRKLSVPPSSIEPVKRRLAGFALAQAESIAAEMLAIRRIGEMESYLADFDARYQAKNAERQFQPLN